MAAAFHATRNATRNAAGAGCPIALILSGLTGGIAVNLPYWSWLQGGEWPWAGAFPLRWIGVGMQTLSVFFHEIGHAVAFWFYGYIGVPSFDFIYGGGEAYAATGQMLPLLVLLDAAMVYGIYRLRDRGWAVAGLALLLLFNLATAFTDAHLAVIAFAGPLGQNVAGGVLLGRLAFGMTDGGAVEKHAHAVIGTGLIGQVFLEGHNLLHNAEYRQFYDDQKGGHDLGDFAHISDLTGMAFDTEVLIWLAAAVLCLGAPLCAGLIRRIASPAAA